MLSSLRRLLSDAWLLFLLSRQVSWNGFRSRSLGSQILLIVFVLAFGAVTAGGSFALGLGVGEILRFYPQLHLEPLIPGVLLAGSLVILLVFSFGAVLGSLFLAKDLDLLMSAPVDRRAIFLAKILDSQGLYYVILAIAAAPALTAYGMRLQYGAGYFVLAMIALLGTPLLPAGVAALLVMVVVRYAPAHRVRETLGLAAAAIGIGFSVLAQTARLWTRQFASLEQAGSLPDMPGILTLLQHMPVVPIPPLMAGRGLVAAGQGQWLPALALLSGFLVSTVGLFIISVIAAERLYVSGWVRLQGSGSARRAPSRSGQANDWLAQAPATLAVALKDWRVFPRDLLGLRQLLAPLVAVPVIYYNLVEGGGGRRAGALRAAERWTEGTLEFRGVIIAALVVFIGTLVLNRMALTSISREAKGWWLLKAAPLTPLELLGGKWLSVAVPYVVLSTVLFVIAVVLQDLHPLWSLYGWFGVEVLGLGTLAVAVAAGVPWARLDWADPRHMVGGWAALVSFFGALALQTVSGALLSAPLLAEVLRPSLLLPAVALGITGATCMTAAFVAGAYHVAARSLARVGEA